MSIRTVPPSERHGEAILPIFIGRGAPFLFDTIDCQFCRHCAWRGDALVNLACGSLDV
jgi:hypothetical protein